MKLSQGFAACAHADAHTLVLGSMPGVASLQADQYYAFPRNAFWRIMGELYAAGPELDYATRLRVLASNGIALWDVIETCHRPGSLDSSITTDGLVTNDFNRFFCHHTQIRQVCFNGQKAASLFKTRVLPTLEGDYQYLTLPSTSPANAASSFAVKLAAWSAIREERISAPGDRASIQCPGC